jgi:hypothetical protein
LTASSRTAASSRGSKLIIVPDDAAEPREYSMPRGVRVSTCTTSRRVRAARSTTAGRQHHGDTEFLIEEQVDKFRFLEENERMIGRRRASRNDAGLRQSAGRSILNARSPA